MHASLEFLVGFLDEDSPRVAQDDFEGAHGPMLRTLQEMGFLSSEPEMNPALSCPYCFEGVPYRVGERFLCNHCYSTVDRLDLLLWRLQRDMILRWIASQLKLNGEVRQVDDCLWQLGTLETQHTVSECFFRRRGSLSDAGRRKLTAHRSVVMFYGSSRPDDADSIPATWISFLEVLRPGASLTVIDREQLLRDRGDVRFEPHSGTIKVGDCWLGEIPFGSREYHFLHCLSRQLDHFVPYVDIKHFVLKQSGSRDSTDEATFCHRLKNRIKEKGWVPNIDLLLVTTNKGDGYRLRGHLGRIGEAWL